ncbi:MAG: hypothetical protein ACLFU9_07955 [Candidatus Bathyarchaeia archaeon]
MHIRLKTVIVRIADTIGPRSKHGLVHDILKDKIKECLKVYPT